MFVGSSHPHPHQLMLSSTASGTGAPKLKRKKEKKVLLKQAPARRKSGNGSLSDDQMLSLNQQPEPQTRRAEVRSPCRMKKRPRSSEKEDSTTASDFWTRFQVRVECHDFGILVDYRQPEPFLSLRESPFTDFQPEWDAAGLQDPTAIQSAGWPIILEGRDVIVCAKTGSGKTFGYLLPLFAQLLKERNKGGRVSDKIDMNSRPTPSCLVLAPTRELALQIQHEALRFGKTKQIRSVCVYGGPPKHTQINSLKGGANAFPHLIIATPGRLVDFAETGIINLRRVNFLVVDEADRMYIALLPS